MAEGPTDACSWLVARALHCESQKDVPACLSVKCVRSGSHRAAEMLGAALQGALPAVPMSTQSSPQKEVSLNTAREGG